MGVLPKRPKYGPRRRAGLRRRAARVRHEPPRLTSLVTRRLAARRRPAAAVVALRGRYHAAARPARGYAVREQGLQNGCDCERSSGPRRRVACRARATACAAFRTCLGPTRAEGRGSNGLDLRTRPVSPPSRPVCSAVVRGVFRSPLFAHVDYLYVIRLGGGERAARQGVLDWCWASSRCHASLRSWQPQCASRAAP